MLLYSLDLIGTAAFALTGLLIACRNRMDFSRACVLAFATAVGGGTLRDLLLGFNFNSVFWIDDSAYLVVILLCVSVGQMLTKLRRGSGLALQLMDAVGFAALVTVGSAIASQATGSPIVIALMGIVNASGSVAIRNLLSGGSFRALIKTCYIAVACLGGLVFVSGQWFSLPVNFVMAITFIVTLTLRLVAMRGAKRQSLA